MKTSIILLCAFFGLAACGSDKADSADAADAKVDKETVFDPMVETIDKAKAVEALTEQRKGELDKALEAAEGNNP